MAVGRLLGSPSPAQVYLVDGASQEILLQNEEALTARLAELVGREVIRGYRAVSDWVPSERTQREDAARVRRANAVAWRAIEAATGESLDARPVATPTLTLTDLASGPMAGVVSTPWSEGATFHGMVMLDGVDRRALRDLAAAGEGLAGVRFVDSTARFSAVLTDYRRHLGWLLLLGVFVVISLLHWRYRASAWRAYVPTLIGGALALAVFGWAGIPVQIFVVLSLILLLGMGIDYGIFMLEHPGAESVWLAVAIAGVSTLLSFGLLALSNTPALRAFGLCMLIGETAIWLITPVFRKEPAHP
jgi:predicted exporter